MSDPHGTDHDTNEFIGLLTGEASRDETSAMAERLRTCDECRQELVDVVVAHAALTAAARTARAFASPNEPAEELAPLRIPDDPANSRPASRDKPRSRGWRMAWVAAAVVLVAILGVSFGLVRSHHGSTVVAQSTLHPLDGPPNASGSITALAEGSNRVLTVHTRQLRSLSSQTYYEVWLLNPVTLKMLPVGVLPPSGTGTYNMNASLMNGYSAVDVSIQANNGNPAHSKVSVLRGYY